MKLNLGCGLVKLPGYVNIDLNPAVCPDLVLDLASADLVATFGIDSVDAVYASHFLEHLQDPFALVDQLWLVSKPGANWEILVPHKTGEIGNPYHKWPHFTEWTFRFYSPVPYPHPTWGLIGKGTAHEASPTTLEEVAIEAVHGGSVHYKLRVNK